MSPGEVAAKAEAVTHLFDILLPIVPSPDQCTDPALHVSIEYEDQYGRFNIWVGNLGVFAKGHASLDYRLRDSPQQVDLLKEVLDELQRLLLQALKDAGVTNSDPQLSVVPHLIEEGFNDAAYSTGSQTVSWQSSVAYSEMTMESEILTPSQRRIRGIEEAVDYLFRLATAIRRPSMFSQNAKAYKVPLVDEAGLDREQEFLKFAATIIGHRFPQATTEIRDRLARCVVTRRKRFLYRRRHQQKLSYRPKADLAKSGNKNDNEARTVKVFPDRSRAADSTSVPTNRRRPAIPTSQTSASAFSAAGFQTPAVQTAFSQVTRTVAPPSEYVSSLEIPRPPKALPGSKEAECHYCCLMIPITDLTQKEWSKHFLQDLEPYVCTAETCTEGERLFDSKRGWTSHMQDAHCRQWRCVAPGHRPQIFQSQDVFDEHMREVHAGAFQESHLPLLRKRAEGPAPIFQSCPLCGLSSDQVSEDLARSSGRGSTPSSSIERVSKELTKHVALHLQQLAMHSLPGDDPGGEAMESEPSASVKATEQEDQDLPPLSFDSDSDVDVPTSKAYRQRSTSEVGSPMDVESSVLEEWSFLERSTYYGHDRDAVLQPFLRKAYIGNSAYISNCDGPSLPCYFIPYRRNKNFFGRDIALSKVREALSPSQNSAYPDPMMNPRTFALYGPGGMGKTQVACEFVYRHRDEFDVILWVHAENEPWLLEDFNKIALTLGLVEKDSSDARDYGYTREVVKRWLSNPRKQLQDENSELANWLLVYDNVENPKLINNFWPYDGPGSVLVTSRSPFSWAISWPLIPFHTEEARAFLLNLTGRSEIKDHEAIAISEKLGGLPLALTQMAGFIKHRNMDFSDFIIAYGKGEKRQEMLDAVTDPELRPSWYSHNLVSAFALDHLTPGAASLLNVFSMLDPEGIPDDLVTTNLGHVALPGFPQSEDEYRTARDELLGSSLVTRNRMNRKFFVHRIVQDVARIRLSRSDYRAVFLACMNMVSKMWPYEVFPSWRHGVERWSTCEGLFPQISRLLEMTSVAVPSRGLEFAEDFLVIRLLTDAGWYRHERGQSSESIVFNDTAQGLCEHWQRELGGSGSSQEAEEGQARLYLLRDTVAEIVHNKGCISTEINAPESAFAQLKIFNDMMKHDFDTHPGREKVDMRLAISWNELGNAHMLKQEWEQGEKCFLTSIESMKLLTNFQATDLCLPLVNLGLSYWLQFKVREAKEVLDRGLCIRRETLGDSDLGSFVRGRYLHALGNVMSTDGDQDQSLSYHREALQHYKATLGNNHHRTTDLYVKVAEHSIRLKQEETALALLDHALSVYSNGNMYAPEKARATFLRSRVYRRMKEADKAKADADDAARQYSEITGREAGGTDDEDEETLGRGLKQDDFDSLIAFWSR